MEYDGYWVSNSLTADKFAPDNIFDERYAKGEISGEEYRTKNQK